MQFGRFHGIALITVGVMLLGLHTMLYMTTKQVVTGPPEFFNDEARARNVSGTRNPWHSVFDGRCSHPRYAAARRGTRGKKCRQAGANFCRSWLRFWA